MKITNTFWLGQNIGIVVGENANGDKKVYIGVGKGLSEEEDTKIIAENGSPIHLSMMTLIVEALK
jgi:hypothetical protein